MTKLQIAALKPRLKAYQVPIGGGLSVGVLPSGDKLWLFRFRLAGERQVFTLGSYPRMTLVQARTRQHTLQKMVVAGQYPQLHKLPN